MMVRVQKKGSLTIEAALIFPMVLAVMALTMQTGIQLYQECIEEAAEILQEEDFNATKIFRRWKLLGEIVTYAD